MSLPWPVLYLCGPGDRVDLHAELSFNLSLQSSILCKGSWGDGEAK